MQVLYNLFEEKMPIFLKESAGKGTIYMHETDQQIILNRDIAALKNKIQDTRYFAETALCKETQMIYLSVLKEQEELLAKLVEQRNKMLNNP